MNTSIIKVCRLCKSEHEMEVKKTDLEKYEKGEHIQYAFPHLTPAQRELFISGICGKCFDELFAEGEDDETR